MIRRLTSSYRRGSTITESAVVVPILLFLILAILVGGYGVFRYQQIALLAREGVRYASVHGGQYQQETGNPAATPQDVYNNAIVPYAINLDLSQLNYQVTWNTDNNTYHFGLDSNNNPDYAKVINNTVTVTVSYNWFPEVFLIGPLVLSSSATMPMSY
jgi:Flp pilus assembly protein TadG